MNSVNLMGRVVRDPEVRYSQSANAQAVAKFTLAVDRVSKKDGQPDADFISCVAFGQKAEFVGKYFRKGKRYAVTGHIQTGSYTKQDGTKVYTTDVIADSVFFADSNDQATQAPYPAAQAPYQPQQAPYPPNVYPLPAQPQRAPQRMPQIAPQPAPQMAPQMAFPTYQQPIPDSYQQEKIPHDEFMPDYSDEDLPF